MRDTEFYVIKDKKSGGQFFITNGRYTDSPALAKRFKTLDEVLEFIPRKIFGWWHLKHNRWIETHEVWDEEKEFRTRWDDVQIFKIKMAVKEVPVKEWGNLKT